MGMTMTQKILAAHAGLESVTAGQLIEADVSGNLPANTRLPTILTWGKWELNMHFCRRKDLPLQGM